MPDHHDGDRPPDGYEPLTLAAAANRLGISPNAVIQRRKRGSIYARRVAGEWRFWLPPVGTPDDDRVRSRSRATGATGTNDLAAVLSDLIRQNADLSATAAVLAERNRVLTERLAALEAGPVAAADVQPEPSAPPIPMPEPAASARVVAGMPLGRAVAAQDAPNAAEPMRDTTTPERTATGGNRLRRAWDALRGR